ncbi:hypothetical protein [Cupriavidus oxalaticus]
MRDIGMNGIRRRHRRGLRSVALLPKLCSIPVSGRFRQPHKPMLKTLP